MKVTVLIENTSQRNDLTAEHGLSLYIETDTHNILFDTGQSGAFADNAAKLGIDLTQVDLCILSHGHYDHGGGLQTFLEVNSGAPVYVSGYAFEPHYSQNGYIGLEPSLQNSDRMILVSDTTVLAEGITLHRLDKAHRQ